MSVGSLDASSWPQVLNNQHLAIFMHARVLSNGSQTAHVDFQGILLLPEILAARLEELWRMLV